MRLYVYPIPDHNIRAESLLFVCGKAQTMIPNQGTSAAEGKGQDCGEVQLIKKRKEKEIMIRRKTST